jgi:hypothetical protein
LAKLAKQTTSEVLADALNTHKERKRRPCGAKIFEMLGNPPAQRHAKQSCVGRPLGSGMAEMEPMADRRVK